MKKTLPGWMRQVRRAAVVLLCATALVASLPALAVGEDEDAVPEEDRKAITKVLSERAKEIAKEKNDAGLENRRAQYSKKFVPDGDERYRITWTERTAGPQQMTVDRYQVFVAKNDSGDWEIVDKQQRDTFDGMWRGRKLAQVFAFDAIEFDREGLQVRSGPGALYLRFHGGGISDILAYADDIEFSYAPPADIPIPYYSNVHEVWTERFKKQLDYQPRRLSIDCDDTSCRELLASMFKGLPDMSDVALGDAGWEEPSLSDAPRKDLLKDFNDNSKEINDRIDDNPLSGFYPERREDNLYWRVALPKNDDQWVYLTMDSFDAEEVSFGARFPGEFFGTLFSYYSEATRKSGTDPYELETRPDSNRRVYDLYKVDGDIDAALVDPEVIKARVDYGLNMHQKTRRIPYFIATSPFVSENERKSSLTINAVEVEGEEVTYVPTSSSSGLIILPEPVEPGSKLELTMEFEAKAIYKINHAFSWMNRGGWLPFLAFGDMVDTFELSVRVPADYKTLGVGKKVAEETKDGVTRTEWVADSPVVFATIIFGRYIEDDDGDYVAKGGPEGKEIPVTVHVDEVSLGSAETTSFSGVGGAIDAARSGALNIRANSLRPIAVQAATSIDLYEEMSGVPYPYGELNLVNDPLGSFYGQAPSSLIYLGSGVFRGEGAVAEFGGENLAKFNKSVVAHEVGHQWWGSAIANANFRNYWFVESLAEYFSAVWLEQAFGKKEYQEQVDEWRRRILDVEQFHSVQRAGVDWGGESPGAARQAAIYNKGPYAFHILRETFGDEKFFAALKQMSQELAEKGEVVTLDIQRALEKAFGGVGPDGQPYNVDLGWFFDQWIRGVGVPEYSFNYQSRQNEEGQWIVEGVVKQRIVMGNKYNKVEMDGQYYRGVVPITISASGQTFQKRMLVEGPETPFRVIVPQRPDKIAFNADGEILSFDVLENQPF